MSWGIATAPAVPATGMDKAIADLAIPEGTYPEGMQAAMELACASAKQALLLMFHSKAFGPDDDPTVFYRASASGHANPGARPLSGWSDDFVNVMLIQVKPPEPVAPPNQPATGIHAPSVV